LFEALDAVVGENGYAVFTDAIEPKAAIFRFPEGVPQPSLFGNVREHV
jgi:hypothetical protein